MNPPTEEMFAAFDELLEAAESLVPIVKRIQELEVRFHEWEASQETEKAG